MTERTNDDDQVSHERQWFIVGRWQEYAGERRANLLRLIGISGFYLIELMNFYGVNFGWLQIASSVKQEFHQTVTAIAVTWALVALGTEFCLRQRIFPEQLKYITTGTDLALLTLILLIADGPRSPLVVCYFLVIMLSGLRFQLRLVWCSTLGAMAGYLALLGYAKWFATQGGPDRPPRNLTVPRYHELIMLLALALTGIVLGQIVRRVRALAEDFSRRMEWQRRKLDIPELERRGEPTP